MNRDRQDGGQYEIEDIEPIMVKRLSYPAMYELFEKQHEMNMELQNFRESQMQILRELEECKK